MQFSDTIIDLGGGRSWGEPEYNEFNEPDGLAFDASGNLFVANMLNFTISEITPSGKVSTFVSGLTYQPTGLAFNSNGDLFVGSTEGTIGEITPSGTVSTFVSGLGSINFLAFQPTLATPEPSSLTLLALGIACLAGYNWRRRKVHESIFSVTAGQSSRINCRKRGLSAFGADNE